MVRLVTAIVCVLLALFTALGPMDTRDSLTLLQRLAYFGMCGAMQIPICYAAAVLTLFLARNLSARQIALALTATSLVVAAPCAAIVQTAYGLFHAGQPPEDRLSSIYLVCALDLWSAVALCYYVLCLRLRRSVPRSADVGATPANARPDAGRVAGATRDARTPYSTASADEIAHQGGLPQRPPAYAAAETPVPVPRERSPITEPEDASGDVAPGSGQPDASSRHSQFFKRLSADIGRDVVYLRVSGHYVRVFTSAGSDVILMRLADAVDALGDLGMQVHRSYWASYRHMSRLVRREGRMLLRLTGALEIPVSRPYLRAVRAALPNKTGPPPLHG